MSYAYGGKKTRQEKEYIGMVKSYYEGTQRSRQERPGEVAENSSGTAGIERPQAFARISVEVEDALKKIEDVVGNSSGTAWIKEPHAFTKMSVEIEDTLDGTPRKKSRIARDDVNKESNEK
ncbi:hypothetical protein Tco_0856121 [Tanacetum coccineum]